MNASWKWDLWFSHAFQVCKKSTTTVQDVTDVVWNKSGLLEHKLFLLNNSTKKVRDLCLLCGHDHPKKYFLLGHCYCHPKGESSWAIVGKETLTEMRGNSFLGESQTFSNLLQTHLWMPFVTERKYCHFVLVQQAPRRVITSWLVLWWEGSCTAAAHEARI